MPLGEHRQPVLRLAAITAVLLFASGCTLLEGLADRDLFGVEGTPPIVSDRFILASDQQRIVGDIQTIEAHYEDTFVDIARTYNLGFDELVQANPGVDPWLPGEGTQIVLPTHFILPDAPRRGIVINTAAKRLFYFPAPDEAGVQVVVTYPIGIGKEGAATPTGATTVTAKGRDPVWHVPASIRREYAAAGNPLPAQVPPGPDNPLGKFVLILGMPSYLIHGTNKPAGVGMRVSHGCVRLFPENIEHLFDLAAIGTPVTIVDQPYVFGWEGDELFIEAHPPLMDDRRDWTQELPKLLATAFAERPDVTQVADEARIAAAIETASGMPIGILPDSLGPDEILARAIAVNNLVDVSYTDPDDEVLAATADE
jgi:L,D-transpeptidase ErfK/SrfK